MIYMLRYVAQGHFIEVYYDTGIHHVKGMYMHSFIDAWCMQYGSTMEGRRIPCAKHLGIHQKVPILISEKTQDIIFPTRDVRSEACVWLNYRSIDYVKGNHKQTTIHFLNGTTHCLMVDVRSIKRGMRLCKEYIQILASSPI